MGCACTTDEKPNNKNTQSNQLFKTQTLLQYKII